MPIILPYLPLPKDLSCSLAPHSSIKRSLAFKPKAFSAKLRVLLSGVSIPANLTRCLVKVVLNPRSISTSIVSQSITLTSVQL